MTNLRAPVPVNDLKRHFQPLAAELAEVSARVVASGRFILGEECERFEAEFAAYCGVRHCVGTANGTDALELALRALEIGPGARVATVANAGMYGTAAILAVGASPVYIEIDPVTMAMSPQHLAAAPAFDAVIVTHLYGRMADMPAILQAAGGKPVIEDCSQAHGAVLRGRKAGAWGILGCFSFYPTKNLGALGDAGGIVTGDPVLAARLRTLRQYGWTAKYVAGVAGGRNSRLDEIQAAVLSIMLPHVDRWNDRRREIVAQYRMAFAGSEVELSPPAMPETDVAHLCVVRSPYRDQLRASLALAEIGTDIHYPLPDYRQPAVTARIGETPSLAETERCAAEVLSLPCFPELRDEEVERVIEAVLSTMGALPQRDKMARRN